MKFQHASSIVVAIALAVLVGTAAADSSGVLTSKTGMTMYTFDKDSAGKSNCHGQCLALWPAVPVADAPSADRNFSSVAREDGTKQLTYKNQPLYYFIKDTKPGDTHGDKVKGVWHVIPKNGSSASLNNGAYADSGYSHSNSY